MVLFGAIGVAPDLDLLFGVHSGPTHGVGAAMLAAVGSGTYEDLHAATEAMDSETTCFEPKMGQFERERRLTGWHDALGQV